MAITEVVISPAGKLAYGFAVSGAGSNIPVGTLMQQGKTAATNLPIAIPAIATLGDSTDFPIGILAELHNYSASGDATVSGTVVSWYPNGILATNNTQFPFRSIELLDVSVIFRMDYAIANATQVAVASASSTVLTITSTEANLDGAFAYVMGGTGIGQLAFVKSSTTSAWTVTSAMATACDSTSKLLKILPNLYNTPTYLVNTATVPTALDSIAAIGTARAIVLGSYLQKSDGIPQRMDPKVMNGMTGLNSISNLAFFSHLQVQNSIWHPLA